MATLELRDLRKSFGPVEVVPGVNLDVSEHEFVVLVGPSGCGKSTILRMIAGLEEPTFGDIVIDGAVVTQCDPKDRDIAMVFQDYALYPQMTVAENMEDTTGALYAFVVMVLAPGLLVFLMPQSAFMRGLTTGATKG